MGRVFGFNERIILEWILKLMWWTGFSRLRMLAVPLTGSCEGRNEISGYVKTGGLFLPA
jgi:hypothetical protein